MVYIINFQCIKVHSGQLNKRHSNEYIYAAFVLIKILSFHQRVGETDQKHVRINL